MGDVMDFLGGCTPSPFQKLAFSPNWLQKIENDLRLRFDRQQNEIRVLRDENDARLRNAPRPTSTTRAVHDSASEAAPRAIASSPVLAPTTPIAVVSPTRAQEEEWEEAAEPEEGLLLFM